MWPIAIVLTIIVIILYVRAEHLTVIRRGPFGIGGIIDSMPIFSRDGPKYSTGIDTWDCDECPNQYVCPHCPQMAQTPSTLEPHWEGMDIKPEAHSAVSGTQLHSGTRPVGAMEAACDQECARRGDSSVYGLLYRDVMNLETDAQPSQPEFEYYAFNGYLYGQPPKN